MKITPEFITKLKPDEIFCFGSNEAGIHGAGAAAMAIGFGAIPGKGFGLHGQTFAIPTKDSNINTLPLEDIQNYVDAFRGVVTKNPQKEFIITKIGCGLAGYNIGQIAPLFASFYNLQNVSLPIEFWDIINGFTAKDAPIYGFKAFRCERNEDGSIKSIFCAPNGEPFFYEIGRSYHHEGEISICSRGFHFCEKIQDTLNYYQRDGDVIYCRVVGWGRIQRSEDKICASDIKILELYTHRDSDFNSGNWNSGDGNSGDGNSGDRNSGNCNSGNCNSGNWNSGDRNSGDGNSGNWNSGNRNSGDRNSGNCNSGNWNSGDCNSGNWNSGDRNSGDRNSGNCNSGNWNSGNWNSGDGNSGNRNSGNCNSGDRNSGNCNSGNWNSGNWNSGDGNKQFLCTQESPTYFFNKASDKRIADVNIPQWMWFNLEEWVGQEDMTEQQREDHPYYKTTGGCLIHKDFKTAAQESYNKSDKEDQDLIEQFPNYDPQILFEIFGIDRR